MRYAARAAAAHVAIVVCMGEMGGGRFGWTLPDIIELIERQERRCSAGIRNLGTAGSDASAHALRGILDELKSE